MGEGASPCPLAAIVNRGHSPVEVEVALQPVQEPFTQGALDLRFPGLGIPAAPLVFGPLDECDIRVGFDELNPPCDEPAIPFGPLGRNLGDRGRSMPLEPGFMLFPGRDLAGEDDLSLVNASGMSMRSLIEVISGSLTGGDRANRRSSSRRGPIISLSPDFISAPRDPQGILERLGLVEASALRRSTSGCPVATPGPPCRAVEWSQSSR